MHLAANLDEFTTKIAILNAFQCSAVTVDWQIPAFPDRVRGRSYGPKLDLSCSFHSPSIDVKIYSESKIPITELS
jgi:hypothetical protein